MTCYFERQLSTTMTSNTTAQSATKFNKITSFHSGYNNHKICNVRTSHILSSGSVFYPEVKQRIFYKENLPILEENWFGQMVGWHGGLPTMSDSHLHKWNKEDFRLFLYFFLFLRDHNIRASIKISPLCALRQLLRLRFLGLHLSSTAPPCLTKDIKMSSKISPLCAFRQLLRLRFLC